MNDRQPLSLDYLLSIPRVGAFSVTPAGGRIVVQWDREGQWDLFLVDGPGAEPQRLTDGREAALDPSWDPAGERLAFVSDRAGDENFDIFVMRPGESAPVNLTGGGSDNHAPLWSLDGQRIAFTSNRGGDNLNLFVMNADGSGVQAVTSGEVPVFGAVWSPCGDALLYGRGMRESEVWLKPLDDRPPKRLLGAQNVEFEVDEGCWLPDGSGFFFISNEHDIFDIGRYHMADGAVEWVVTSPHEKSEPRISPDGAQLAYLEHRDGNLVARVRDLPSGPDRVASPERGVASTLTWDTAGNLYYLYNNAQRPNDLWVFASDGALRQLTNSLPADFPSGAAPEPAFVRFPSFDGREITALVTTPRSPSGCALVDIHGGPESHELNNWDPVRHFLVDAGYVHITPNYRGSTGFGRKFLRLADFDLGGGDLRDVVASADYLIAQGLARQDAVGVFGGSYGGYLTMMALTQHPGRWAAGATIVGFFNWVTEFETEREYLKFYDSQKVGTPAGNPEFYFERSPINFADRVRCPLLILHGEQDPRCPVSEARQLAATLEKQGTPFDLVTYPDEGHGFRKRTNRIDAWTRVRAFFREHLPVAETAAVGSRTS